MVQTFLKSAVLDGGAYAKMAFLTTAREITINGYSGLPFREQMAGWWRVRGGCREPIWPYGRLAGSSCA